MTDKAKRLKEGKKNIWEMEKDPENQLSLHGYEQDSYINNLVESSEDEVSLEGALEAKTYKLQQSGNDITQTILIDSLVKALVVETANDKSKRSKLKSSKDVLNSLKW